MEDEKMLNKIFKNILHLGIMLFLLPSCTNQKETQVHTHVYSELVDKVEATCVDNGMAAHYTCLECEKLFDVNKNETSEEDLIIPATGHHYSNSYEIDETHHALKCDVCGAIDENSKVAHNFNRQIKNETYKVADHTCLTGSKYYYSCVCGAKGSEIFEDNDATGHNPSDTWKYDETHHWHECLNDCEEKLDYDTHTFDQEIKTIDYLKEAATCQHGNVYCYSCICGAKSDSTFDDGAIIEHSGSHYDYLPFTATSNGTRQFWQCDICEEIYLLEDGLFSIEKVRYSDSKTLQLELPTLIDIGTNFLATDTGFNVKQDGSSQQAGWFGYVTTPNNESTISVNFNKESKEGDVFYLLKNSLITDKNNKQYKLDKDYKFIYQNSAWIMETTPTIPAGTWVEKGVAPAVDDDDIRSVWYSIDLTNNSLHYSDKNHIQISIDLELEAEDGVILDVSHAIIKRNGEKIEFSAQYFQSHILSLNLGFDDAAAGDVITIEKGSIIKLQIGDNVINRKINAEAAYLYNGTGQWRKAKFVEFGLPSITNVQYNMVLLQDENYFGVSDNTNCYYTGSVKANGTEYSGLPQGATLGLFFNNLSISPGFTFQITKGTYFDCNNVLIINAKEYAVSWNGSQWSFIE